MKNRKERNRVFRSIENGDFGSDWPTGGCSWES
jgi:hypothetical protein